MSKFPMDAPIRDVVRAWNVSDFILSGKVPISRWYGRTLTGLAHH
jgi:hypothetical protein